MKMTIQNRAATKTLSPETALRRVLEIFPDEKATVNAAARIMNRGMMAIM